MLLTASLAVDHQRAKLDGETIASALDYAALAAVMDQSLTPDERAEFAEVYFKETHGRDIDVEFDVVDSSNERVELSANFTIQTLLGGIVGTQNITVFEQSAAVLTKEDTICVLALAETGSATFEVKQGAKLIAPTCSVQVNSTDDNAVYTGQGGTALAKSFCTAGAYVSDSRKSSFQPSMKSRCSQVADPYKDRKPPQSGVCVDAQALSATLESWQASNTGVTLYPGTYCGGLELSGKTVTFAPGTYIMKDGPLKVMKQSSVMARNVTVVLSGADAVVNLENGSSFEITGAQQGALAGFAFMEDMRDFKTATTEFPTGTSTLFSGAELNIVGLVYTPGQHLKIGGGSNMGARAPATSYIGYQVSIEKGASLNVAVDHVKAGLPPLLPRTDEGARLVK